MKILDEKVQIWIDSARFAKPKPAVYVFYDRKSTVLYIGSTENLQEEFTQYLDTDFQSNPCKQKTFSYQKIFVDEPEKKQAQLLDDFTQTNGIKPVCNS